MIGLRIALIALLVVLALQACSTIQLFQGHWCLYWPGVAKKLALDACVGGLALTTCWMGIRAEVRLRRHR